MFNLSMEFEAQARRRDMLQEADDYRLLKKSQADRLKFQERLLLGIGDFLIASGRRLKARCRRERLCPPLSGLAGFGERKLV